jgi:hypothetical protein
MPIYVIEKGKNEINNHIYNFYVSMMKEIWDRSSMCKKEDYYAVQTTSR